MIENYTSDISTCFPQCSFFIFTFVIILLQTFTSLFCSQPIFYNRYFAYLRHNSYFNFYLYKSHLSSIDDKEVSIVSG